MDTNSFEAWLLAEMDRRLWTMTDLAKQAGISQATVSLVLSGQRKPGARFCSGVARAFGEPANRVFRLAGLMPRSPVRDELIDDDITFGDLLDLMRHLSPEERQEAYDYIRYRYQRQRERENAASAHNPAASVADVAR